LAAKDFLGGQNYTTKKVAIVDNQEIYIYISWQFCCITKKTMDLLGSFIGLPRKWCIFLAVFFCIAKKKVHLLGGWQPKK
jgi:hypothetical protein